MSEPEVLKRSQGKRSFTAMLLGIAVKRPAPPAKRATASSTRKYKRSAPALDDARSAPAKRQSTPSKPAAASSLRSGHNAHVPRPGSHFARVPNTARPAPPSGAANPLDSSNTSGTDAVPKTLQPPQPPHHDDGDSFTPVATAISSAPDASSCAVLPILQQPPHIGTACSHKDTAAPGATTSQAGASVQPAPSQPSASTPNAHVSTPPIDVTNTTAPLTEGLSKLNNNNNQTQQHSSAASSATTDCAYLLPSHHCKKPHDANCSGRLSSTCSRNLHSIYDALASDTCRAASPQGEHTPLSLPDPSNKQRADDSNKQAKQQLQSHPPLQGSLPQLQPNGSEAAIGGAKHHLAPCHMPPCAADMMEHSAVRASDSSASAAAHSDSLGQTALTAQDAPQASDDSAHNDIHNADPAKPGRSMQSSPQRTGACNAHPTTASSAQKAPEAQEPSQSSPSYPQLLCASKVPNGRPSVSASLNARPPPSRSRTYSTSSFLSKTRVDGGSPTAKAPRKRSTVSIILGNITSLGGSDNSSKHGTSASSSGRSAQKGGGTKRASNPAQLGSRPGASSLQSARPALQASHAAGSVPRTQDAEDGVEGMSCDHPDKALSAVQPEKDGIPESVIADAKTINTMSVSRRTSSRWSEFARDGAPWTAEEEAWLISQWQSGTSVDSISRQLSRTKSAVNARLKKHRAASLPRPLGFPPPPGLRWTPVAPSDAEGPAFDNAHTKATCSADTETSEGTCSPDGTGVPAPAGLDDVAGDDAAEGVERTVNPGGSPTRADGRNEATDADQPAEARPKRSALRTLFERADSSMASSRFQHGKESQRPVRAESSSVHSAPPQVADATSEASLSAQVAYFRLLADFESEAKANAIKVQNLLEGWATIFRQSASPKDDPPRNSHRLGAEAHAHRRAESSRSSATHSGGSASDGSSAPHARRKGGAPAPAASRALTGSVTQQVESLAFAPTPVLHALSNAELKCLLAQADCKEAETCLERGELLQLAAANLGRWEVQRILACKALPAPQRHFAVLRLSPALLAGGRGSGAPDGGAGGDSCVAREARIAFRKLSLQAHPDKCLAPGSEDAFHMLQSAFHYFQHDCLHP